MIKNKGGDDKEQNIIVPAQAHHALPIWHTKGTARQGLGRVEGRILNYGAAFL